jgi:hypothetical protein
LSAEIIIKPERHHKFNLFFQLENIFNMFVVWLLFVRHPLTRSHAQWCEFLAARVKAMAFATEGD